MQNSDWAWTLEYEKKRGSRERSERIVKAFFYIWNGWSFEKREYVDDLICLFPFCLYFVPRI